MAMRQAAILQGARSEKVQRLIELVAEAEDNGRRVIVFSHFRVVLDEVANSLPGEVFGPLTGSVPAAARQLMVDRFSAAGHGAVLVAQPHDRAVVTDDQGRGSSVVGGPDQPAAEEGARHGGHSREGGGQVLA